MHAEPNLVQNSEDESWLQIALQEGNVFFPILQPLPLMREDAIPKDMHPLPAGPIPIYGFVATQLMNNSINQQLANRFHNIIPQNNAQNNNIQYMLPFVSLHPNNLNSLCDIKKRKRPMPQKVRRVRPKVVEGKGSIQCSGLNLKKNCRCKNAALMEYTGPRPTYCAEHIDQDPNSMYAKCKSMYQKTPGDKKGCKQVVLKEFGMCYKHFNNHSATLTDQEVETLLRRVKEILSLLEVEAAEAKKDRQDLYQRKNKLIPKYQKIKMILEQRSLSFASNIGSDNAFFNSLLEHPPFPQMTGSNDVKQEDKEQPIPNDFPLNLDDDFSLFYNEPKSLSTEAFSNPIPSNDQGINFSLSFNAINGQNICF